MKKGELHWETLAKLLIMIIVIIIAIYLIIAFRDNIINIFETLKDNF